MFRAYDKKDCDASVVKQIKKFQTYYPYNLLPRKEFSDIYITDLDNMLESYINEWRTEAQSNIVILTYSRANCEKTNYSIQDKIDLLAERELPETRKLVKFHVGDRCCLDKPIEVCNIIRQINNVGVVHSTGDISTGSEITVTNSDTSNIISNIIRTATPAVTTEYVSLDTKTGDFLYNGEIFDIICVEDVKIKTPLNRYTNDKYFAGQILTVKRISPADSPTYEILHIEEEKIINAKSALRHKTSRDFYLTIMSNFIKYYPKLEYGYCITIYKSQGSEWETVFVNLCSVRYSMLSDRQADRQTDRQTDPASKTDVSLDKRTKEKNNIKKSKSLLKTTYTALSRASHKLRIFFR